MAKLHQIAASTMFVAICALASVVSSGRASATIYTLQSPNWYLGDVNGSNYGYHHLYLQWDGWYSGNTSSDYSELKTTMVSPSSGYYYNSWYAERTDGPYSGGYYVTLTDSGSSYVDYYTNNPQYVSKSWGYGVNGRLVEMACVPPAGAPRQCWPTGVLTS